MTDLAREAWAQSELKQLEGELKNWEVLLRLPSLDGKFTPTEGSKQPQLTDQAREQLKALGYIE